jgi:hypothetical protein
MAAHCAFDHVGAYELFGHAAKVRRGSMLDPRSTLGASISKRDLRA